MVVLAMFVEGPMHAYRVHELIRERGKDQIVNVAQRNSVYQTIDRLLRSKLIDVQKTSREEGRPERVVYKITKEGERTLKAWLTTTLEEPTREFPQFPAALAFLMLLSPKEALAHLTKRKETLARDVAASTKGLEQIRESGLPRLFLIDDEYRNAMAQAELDFVAGLVDAIRSKTITWSEKFLRDIAKRFGAD
jgi:DNA-binding PadR family transcriptional regulator